MKRLLVGFLVLSLTLLPVPAPAQAATRPPQLLLLEIPAAPRPGEQALPATQIVTGTDEMTGSVRIATLLAAYFNRDVQEILNLHAADWGFGNLAKALFTAAEANVPLEQILQMRAQDIGWGEIRQELGLPAGMPHKSLGQIVGRSHQGEDWTPPGLAKKGLEGKNPNRGHGQGKP